MQARQQNEAGGFTERNKVQCYACHGFGHIARNCSSNAGFRRIPQRNRWQGQNGGYTQGRGTRPFQNQRGRSNYEQKGRFNDQGYNGQGARPNYNQGARYDYNNYEKANPKYGRNQNSYHQQQGRGQEGQWRQEPAFQKGSQEGASSYEQEKDRQDAIRLVTQEVEPEDWKGEREGQDEAYWFFKGTGDAKRESSKRTHHSVNYIRNVQSKQFALQGLLRTLIIVGCLSYAWAVNVKTISSFAPQNPVICDKIIDMEGQAHLWKWPAKHECKNVKVKEGVPQEMTIQMYKRNIIEWSTQAFHCQRIRSRASTIKSFWGDSKSVNKSTEYLRVTAHDCLEMARKHQCDMGTLVGSDGVYTMLNKRCITLNAAITGTLGWTVVR